MLLVKNLLKKRRIIKLCQLALMKAFFFHAFIGLFLPQIIIAQGEANMWYFGQFAALDFNSGAPAAVNNSQVFTDEGSASISDLSGNLLFYTDGISLWDKNNNIMPNGNLLMGNPSSTQSGVIIKKPGSTSVYFLFTTDIQGGMGLRYSEVDMTLNGGLGDVVVATKNTLLELNSCEKITGIRHCNNEDIWLISHDWGTNTFRVFLITAAGVNVGLPVLSNVGIVATGTPSEAIGQLKGSPDGTKLASAIWGDLINRFELFDFDNSTGVVSNELLMPQYPSSSGAYGVEFSSDSKKLYCSLITPGNIYQFDLCAGSSAAIIASAIKVGTSVVGFNGSLQLAPDGKIYVAQYGVNYLGVINNPNASGLACNYVDNGVSLGTGTGTLGLPNFVPYYFTKTIDQFTFSANCFDVSFSAPDNTFSTGGCSSAPYITSISWDFGDISSAGINSSIIDNPTHTYSTEGIYEVKLTLNYRCGSSEIQSKFIEIEDCNPQDPPSLYVPNSFTPNGDGKNNVFLPKGHKVFSGNCSLKIFDRWGQLLYSTNTPDVGWDGKSNGKECQQDVYVYMLDLEKGIDGLPYREIGKVTLLR